MAKEHWSCRVRALHEWSLDYDWGNHIENLNRDHDLTGKNRLSQPIPGWPPAFFNGNIGALRPNDWVLVVSINPALAAPGHYQILDKNESWDFWCQHNRNPANWNSKTGFFPRMARLAAASIGENLEAGREPDFATDRMLFLEFMPYASISFANLDWGGKVKPLADKDIGIAINRQIRQIALIEGKPKTVLLHGIPAINDFKDHQCHDLIESRMEDPLNPLLSVRMWSGVFRGYKHQAPVVGFPFLRHNSSMPALDRRMDLLEDYLRARLT